MALTDDQIAQIRHYLGYQQIARDPWIATNRAGLDYAISKLEEPAGETQVTNLLSDLAALDASLVDARKRLKATMLGNLRIDGVKEINTLKAERKRVARELGDCFGIAPAWDLGGGAMV